MKTLIFKSILVVGVVFGLSNYLIYLKTGKFMVNDIPRFELSSLLPKKMPNKEMLESLVEKTTTTENSLYKWTDASGKTHYSSTPPADNENVKTQLLKKPTVNIVKEYEPAVQEQAAVSTPLQIDAPVPQTISPDAVQKLIEDAKNVQTLMDERTQSLDKSILRDNGRN